MKKVFSFFLSIILILAFPIYAEAEEKPVEVSAKSYILMCINTGDVLCASNENERLSPASVTKVMSLLLIMEAIDNGKISLTDEVTASQNAVDKGGSQIWLELGEKMTVDDLLKSVVISSANDACTALGEYIAGSEAGFVKMMNDKVKELGLKDSVFENCTGLDDTATMHYSTVHDLAVISAELMKHEKIKKYSTVWIDSLRNGETELTNTNKLIKTYKGITGLKTGTTTQAGFCLSATAERDGMSLVAVVLGSKTSKERFDSASALLDYGFANYEVRKPAINEKNITNVKIKKGVIKEITPQYSKAKEILVQKGSGEFRYVYKINQEINAPVKKGTVLGSITVVQNKKTLCEIPLVSPTSVEKVSFKYLFKKFLKLF